MKSTGRSVIITFPKNKEKMSRLPNVEISVTSICIVFSFLYRGGF